MVSEPDASERAPKRLQKRFHHHVVPSEPDPIVEASKPIHIGKQVQSQAPRFGQKSKDDVTLEMLRDKRVLETVKREVARSKKTERSKSVLVSLPKIGVRLFTISSPKTGAQSARLPNPSN
jgi:hypothetical protein